METQELEESGSATKYFINGVGVDEAAFRTKANGLQIAYGSFVVRNSFNENSQCLNMDLITHDKMYLTKEEMEG